MSKKMNFHSDIQNNHTKWLHLTAKQTNCLLAGVSVLVVFLLFYFFRHLSPFVYQTNDDLFLRMIASGEMSGVPESHLFYISYPAGLLVSSLYRLLPQLPWYGLFLYFSFGLGMTVILYFLLRLEKSLRVRLLTILLFCLFSYSFLFSYITELQYTIVTGIVGCSALFLFILSSPSESFRETLKNYRGFLLLSAYTLCIRDQVFFMFLPFIGMIGLGKYLDAGHISCVSSESRNFRTSFFFLNKPRKNLLALAGIFTVILTSFLLIEKLAWQQEDWHSFSDYTRSRTVIYDYEGYPDYDTYEETYQELGLSRSSYEAAAHRYSLILEPAINRHSMEVLEHISKQGESVSLKDLPKELQEMVNFFWERHRSDADKPLNLLVFRCYFLFILCSVISKKWIALRDILFALFARMVIWSYLIFYGRLPIRISQTVYLAELSILFAIAFGNRLWELRKDAGNKKSNTQDKEEPVKYNFSRRICLVFWIMSTILILFTCIRSGIPNARATSEESKARLQFSESFVSMKDYFAAHPDCFYYLDTNSFAYFTEDALQSGDFKNSNYIFMGGWAAKSPWYEKKFESVGISDPAVSLYEDPSVYAVFMNTEETNYDYLKAFYAENYPGVSLETVETVDTENGLSFFIVKAHLEKTS